MDPVEAQYEAYPYPAREPADERKRLITGSPSNPVEIDHYCFGGCRDWTQPFRVLVAGGGTGDALIMLAQLLNDAKVPADITYLDLSTASRRIAEARAAVRGLDGIRFVTGDLMTAPTLGRFDYIDCCGVLHHLPDPQAGFDALAAALAPGGGLGAMVYAPLGRSGVYPLQAGLAALTDGLPPKRKIEVARKVLAALPSSHPFRRNTVVGDHQRNDAGLYDLLLHARDRPFTADQVMHAVARAGLTFAGFIEPLRYAPETWAAGAPVPEGLTAAARAALAENLCGAIKVHVFYAVKGALPPRSPSPGLVPRLRNVTAAALAAHVSGGQPILIKRDGTDLRMSLPRDAAQFIRLLDGQKTLGEIAGSMGRDWLGFSVAFAPIHAALTGHGMMLYSSRFA